MTGDMKLRKDYDRKRIKTSIETQRQHWSETGNYQWKELNLSFTQKKIDSVFKSQFTYYIRKENEKYACESHAHIIYLYKKFDLGTLIYEKITIWEDTGGCTKQYKYAL